ncbi:hypothetical protein JL722_4549 [Aureococcus anophagefferens]|nr:hypothetical protein JL722_4549 [Aureococcus anophagefferens]
MVQARGAWLLAGLLGRGHAGNPIMLPSLGIADPHAHVWPADPDTVFVYATHDCSPSGRGNCTASRGLGFRMDDWPKQIGVVSGPTARGPFSDPIGKALVPEGLVPSYSRDPCVFREGDDYYLIWGTFSYYEHRDDKPFVHRANGLYYLSWGCFYAVSNSSVYGPYDYVGSFIDAATLENTSFASGGGTADRHGASSPSTTRPTSPATTGVTAAGYRNTIVNYVHYAANGSIAPLRIDEVGVGAFDVAASPRVEAENYFSASGAAAKRETAPASPWASGGRGARVQRGPQRAPGATLRLVGAGDAVFEVAADGAEIGTCGVGAPGGPLPAGDVAVLAVAAVRGAGTLDALEII